jgi:hypothetical protein
MPPLPLMLLVVTPLFVALSFVFFVVIVTRIDRVVTKFEPAAPRYIFPPLMAIGGDVGPSRSSLP